jgi:PadR family transcriptional regulator PadR
MTVDAQQKKGLLDICVLYLLSQEQSYGYKLIADMKKLIAVTESTLYPILKRLEIGGLVTTKAMEYGGRLRRYYFITESGRVRLEEGKQGFIELSNVYNKIIEGEK